MRAGPGHAGRLEAVLTESDHPVPNQVPVEVDVFLGRPAQDQEGAKQTYGRRIMGLRLCNYRW